ncbi:TauD/TfdA dioxygenase family protein [Nocardia stercoris]|uniref:TauD/TfdA family dioxygenase n=1 Tax=Nocardia stercoris TaxID=2483361 RepID=A0A3M2L185_9NOCA|nr:TauD/TfdA family dioxygenase [Nocardia stercoris]RMI31331.1 TauD/TfdA family dioxygenase [Nocardia stercoris]
MTAVVTAESVTENDLPQGITVRRVAGHIGAEIGGVDLAAELDDTVIAAVRRELLRHKVIFFRDQNIGHAEQIAFARRFGELTHAHPHEDAPPAEFPEILTIDPVRYEQKYGKAFRDEYRKRQYTYYSGWHTDVTAAVNPPAASLLRAEVVPEFGGDTTWSNQVAAYAGLSEPLRAFVDGLRAEHRFLAGQEAGDESDELSRRIKANLLVSVHPVVRVHPETEEKALFVNPGFTHRIVDVSSVESRKLLDLLFEHLTQPEYTVRFRWQPGSVAFWDNRATTHLGPQDLGHLDVQRTLHRVTLIGDRPVGPDGFTSEIVAGQEFRATADVKTN